jgi:hypothetical protein
LPLKTQLKARSLSSSFTNLELRSAASAAAVAVDAIALPLCVLMRDEEVESLAMAPITSEDDVLRRRRYIW